MNEQTNLPEISVGELSLSIKRTMEDTFSYVRVRGEVFNYKGPHSSGHAYFCLKDSDARIDAIIWRGTLSKLRFKPEEGLEVVVTGKVSTYPGRSTYQLIIESLEPAGAGALMALLEERKKALAAEGLFREDRKVRPPYLPRVIGVVTSPTGAVIRDILHRLTDRFPTHVLVWPARVQGEGAAEQVACAIRGFDSLPVDGPIPRPEVLIVARGGGSLEDLWCFNEEIVVRAAAECRIPLISAVGHETDWTLIDLAADVRAPTPTAAAEMAVPVRAELAAVMEDRSRRLWGSLSRLVQERRNQLRAAERGLPRLSDLLAMPRQRLDQLSDGLPRALRGNTVEHRNRLAVAASRLGGLRGMLVLPRQRLVTLGAALRPAVRNATREHRGRYELVASRLTRRPLDERFARAHEKLDRLAERRDRCAEAALQRRREKLDRLSGLLEALSHRATLERGFALVYREDGSLIHRAAEGAPGEAVRLSFADGDLDARVAGGAEPQSEPARPSRPARQAKPPAKQSDLFGE